MIAELTEKPVRARARHPKARGSPQVAFLGTYHPRKCGIATFTQDLRQALCGLAQQAEYPVVAMDDGAEAYAYPPEVLCRIVDQSPESFRAAAAFLNASPVEVVSLQHEFGIFGGAAGSHLLHFLRELEKPVVTTLHTILSEPNADQRAVLGQVLSASARVVVMTERGRSLLHDIYGVPAAKVDLIAHGIHDMPYEAPARFKEQFSLGDRLVLLTFGLLSPSKGIEKVIEALPRIIVEFPNVTYLVLGATHPSLVREQGEAYREGLQALALKLGVGGHVLFHNSYVGLAELKDFIGAADLYLTPYLNEQQVVSGTLAYAFGAGKAVLSTPYWHASELLAEGRGVLVSFADSGAIAHEVCGLLRDDTRRIEMGRRAYEVGRGMVWHKAAEHYRDSFARARLQRPASELICSSQATRSGGRTRRALPAIKPDHVLRLTDSAGMLQHALFTTPSYVHGYCTDDNARALVLALLWQKHDFPKSGFPAGGLVSRYLAFLSFAFDSEAGCFRNFLGYDRRWLATGFSEDCQGRALWALGACARRALQPSDSALAVRLFLEALPGTARTVHPRTWAYALLGLDCFLALRPSEGLARELRMDLSARLLKRFDEHTRGEWQWLADDATYDNARLPHSLILTGAALGNAELLETGLRALRWLVQIQSSSSGGFQPIGSDGFCHRNGTRAHFDQQPIEVQATVAACLAAHRVTGEPEWLATAQGVFDWFLGRNDLGRALYDESTGGCRDALHIDRVNENQGAESTLAFHLALAELSEVRVLVPAVAAAASGRRG